LLPLRTLRWPYQHVLSALACSGCLASGHF